MVEATKNFVQKVFAFFSSNTTISEENILTEDNTTKEYINTNPSEDT
jgi:hypothetical protein